MRMSLQRMIQLGLLASLFLAIVILLASCDLDQTIYPATYNGRPDPALDTSADVVYVKDPASGYCYGVGSKYLATMPPADRILCDHQGPLWG